MRPKLLLVSAIMPFPKNSGGAVRLFNTIKYMSEKYEIYGVFWQDKNYQFSVDEKKWLDKHTKLWTTFPLWCKQKLSWLSYGQPYYFNEWFNPEAGYVIDSLIRKHKIESVQIEFTQLLYLRSYVPFNIKAVFVAHDISSISFERRFAENKKGLKRKLLHTVLLAQIRQYEQKWLPQFDAVVAMSETDADVLQQQFGVKKAQVLPNGIEEITAIPGPNNEFINLGFIGGFTHTPNEKAVEFFIKQVAPGLEEEKVNYRYVIAGENDEQKIREWIKEAGLKDTQRIVNMGFVKNAKDFYRQIDALVVTLFSGSGTRIKVMEALGLKRAVIATKVGAEGINIKTPQLQIASTAMEIITKIKEMNPKQKFDTTNLDPYLWRNIFK